MAMTGNSCLIQLYLFIISALDPGPCSRFQVSIHLLEAQKSDDLKRDTRIRPGDRHISNVAEAFPCCWMRVVSVEGEHTQLREKPGSGKGLRIGILRVADAIENGCLLRHSEFSEGLAVKLPGEAVQPCHSAANGQAVIAVSGIGSTDPLVNELRHPDGGWSR